MKKSFFNIDLQLAYIGSLLLVFVFLVYLIFCGVRSFNTLDYMKDKKMITYEEFRTLNRKLHRNPVIGIKYHFKYREYEKIMLNEEKTIEEKVNHKL